MAVVYWNGHWHYICNRYQEIDYQWLYLGNIADLLLQPTHNIPHSRGWGLETRLRSSQGQSCVSSPLHLQVAGYARLAQGRHIPVDCIHIQHWKTWAIDHTRLAVHNTTVQLEVNRDRDPWREFPRDRAYTTVYAMSTCIPSMTAWMWLILYTFVYYMYLYKKSTDQAVTLQGLELNQ